MRSIVATACLVASTSALAEPAEAPAPANPRRVLIGIGAGIVVSAPIGGAIAEAGVRLAGPLWLHGAVADVGPTLVRGGLELQLGDPGNVLVLGLDVGRISGIAIGLDAGRGMAIASPRIGFDLGGGPVHVRLCAEGEAANGDLIGVAATATLAFER
jgi:hypothetical protein